MRRWGFSVWSLRCILILRWHGRNPRQPYVWRRGLIIPTPLLHRSWRGAGTTTFHSPGQSSSSSPLYLRHIWLRIRWLWSRHGDNSRSGSMRGVGHLRGLLPPLRQHQAPELHSSSSLLLSAAASFLSAPRLFCYCIRIFFFFSFFPPSSTCWRFCFPSPSTPPLLPPADIFSSPFLPFPAPSANVVYSLLLQ